MLRILQTIDRRALYFMLMLAVTTPFFLYISLPVNISPQTKALYDKVDSLPSDSFVLFGLDWSASTRGENGAQTEALMRHFMKRRVRFALLAFGDPQAETLGQAMAERLQKEYSYVEGKDWTNFGYHPSAAQENTLKAMVQDVVQTMKNDNRKHPLGTLEVMHGIKTARDFSLIIDVTPSNTYLPYIQFLQGPAQVPMGSALTSVMAPEMFNYIDSKQVVGMMGGLQGAIEYEQLLHIPGKATRAGLSSSFAHLLIMGLIIVGNIALLLEKRQRRMTAEGSSA